MTISMTATASSRSAMSLAQERLMKASAMEAEMNAASEDGDLGEVAILATQGDGSDRPQRTSPPASAGGALTEEPQEIAYSNIQEIIDGLFIGDFTAAMDGALLQKLGITHVVAAMRQRYPVPAGITIHRILIDDTSKTNIIRHFAESNAFIRQARSQGKKVLVHCQAGVSRSTTLSAAFLMEEFDLTAEDAVAQVAAVRSVTCPAEFFVHQLELYELCNCNPDPATSAEYRRFLMNYMAQDMLDGDGVDNLILAYYPTPAPSPRRSPSVSDPFLAMTTLDGAAQHSKPNSRRGSSNSVTSHDARSEIISRVRRGSSISGGLSGSLGMSSMTPLRRMSEGEHLGDPISQMARRRSSRRSGSERNDDITKLRALLADKQRKEALEIANAGIAQATANQVKQRAAEQSSVITAARQITHIKGRKLRCKMCRRELAAREHILQHEPGQGQKAFAPRRQDMTQHRMDTEKRRQVKAAERAARQEERRKVAAEAAEDILQEAEEEAASDSGSSDDHQDESASGMQVDKPAIANITKGISKAGSKNCAPSSATAPKLSTNTPESSVRAGMGASSRTLNARLPPALANLRVAMPSVSMPFTMSGSAIDDDEPTPSHESPPSPPLLLSMTCTSYFTEPLSWMRHQLENGEISGKIICPNQKCGSKLGNFDWSGLQCSCAAWICPGFALAVSKVDEVRS